MGLISVAITAIIIIAIISTFSTLLIWSTYIKKTQGVK